MATHQNHYTSADSAAESPLARYLRRVGGVGVLFTINSDAIARAMGYRTHSRIQVVAAGLRELKRNGVIEYVSERGYGAEITMRVLR